MNALKLLCSFYSWVFEYGQTFHLCSCIRELCFVSTQTSLSHSGYWVHPEMNNGVDHNNSLPLLHPNLWPLGPMGPQVTVITSDSPRLHHLSQGSGVCLNNLKESKVPNLNYMSENHIQESQNSQQWHANQLIQYIYNSLQFLSSEMLNSYPKAVLISCSMIYYLMFLIDVVVLGEIPQWKTLISLVPWAKYFLPGLTYKTKTE